eukprot:SAG11_NODE_12574_length_696_cov_1.700168_1_plen_107_part_00
MAEFERHGRTSVVGGEMPTDPGRQGADDERESAVGVADGGFAAAADRSGAQADPALEEGVGEEEEEMWSRAMETPSLEEDANLALERAELDEIMSERASLHTLPED